MVDGSNQMIDAPWYVDLMVCTLIVIAAGAQYTWIALLGHSVARWMTAIGWTGLALRMGVALAVDGNVPINALSLPFLSLIAGGTALTAWRHIVAAGDPQVNCFRDPAFRCAREDRIVEARARLLHDKRGSK